MSETLDTPIPPMDDLAEREARADAAKMTRYFMMFAAPLLIMFVVLIGAFAWKLSHPKTLPAASSAVAAATADKDAEIAQLRNQIATLQGQPAASTGQAAESATPSDSPAASPVPATPYSSPSNTTAQLTARMDRLEASQKALARAANAAYAARALQLAAHDGDPFLSELAAAEPTIDDAGLASSLRPYAERGVPSEITLAVRFPAAAAKANIAAETKDGKTGVFDQIAHALNSFISVRRTDNLDGQGTQAVLARAESRLNLGDLHGAVGYLTALQPAARQAMKAWLDDAQARLLVDDTTRRISEKAMNRFGQIANNPVTSDPAANTAAYGATPDGGLL